MIRYHQLFHNHHPQPHVSSTQRNQVKIQDIITIPTQFRSRTNWDNCPDREVLRLAGMKFIDDTNPDHSEFQRVILPNEWRIVEDTAYKIEQWGFSRLLDNRGRERARFHRRAPHAYIFLITRFRVKEEVRPKMENHLRGLRHMIPKCL
jgi:hypothetical protein